MDNHNNISNLMGSICLSDIPKELIRTGKNGKKYLTITVNARQTPSNFGATHYIKAYVKPEERKAGTNYFIGELKPSKPMQQAATNGIAQSALTAAPESDDLPF